MEVPVYLANNLKTLFRIGRLILVLAACLIPSHVQGQVLVSDGLEQPRNKHPLAILLPEDGYSLNGENGLLQGFLGLEVITSPLGHLAPDVSNFILPVFDRERGKTYGYLEITGWTTSPDNPQAFDMTSLVLVSGSTNKEVLRIADLEIVDSSQSGAVATASRIVIALDIPTSGQDFIGTTIRLARPELVFSGSTYAFKTGQVVGTIGDAVSWSMSDFSTTALSPAFKILAEDISMEVPLGAISIESMFLETVNTENPLAGPAGVMDSSRFSLQSISLTPGLREMILPDVNWETPNEIMIESDQDGVLLYIDNGTLQVRGEGVIDFNPNQPDHSSGSMSLELKGLESWLGAQLFPLLANSRFGQKYRIDQPDSDGKVNLHFSTGNIPLDTLDLLDGDELQNP